MGASANSMKAATGYSYRQQQAAETQSKQKAIESEVAAKLLVDVIIFGFPSWRPGVLASGRLCGLVVSATDRKPLSKLSISDMRSISPSAGATADQASIVRTSFVSEPGPIHETYRMTANVLVGAGDSGSDYYLRKPAKSPLQ